MITVKRFYLNDLRECCFILSEPTKECVIVDPGISNKSERDRIVRYIADSGLRPVKLLCTHGHFDHVMGNRFITETYNIPTYIHPADKDLLKLAKNTCMLFSIAIEDPDTRTTDISEGDRITFGNSWLEVIPTPGHTWEVYCSTIRRRKSALPVIPCLPEAAAGPTFRKETARPCATL